MSSSKENRDTWNLIFDDLILENENGPPVKYIKDAIIITKNGKKFKVSATDFANIVAREKTLPPDQGDIMSCSLSIDFTKLKRDVNKWTKKFLFDLENSITPLDLDSEPNK